MLDVQPSEKMIARQAIKASKKLPDRILNKPYLKPYLQLYLNAFIALESTRSTNRDRIERISILNILQYCQYLKLDSEQTEDCIYFVTNLDNVAIERFIKKVSKK